MSEAPIVLGLRANWRQFTLLAVINAFVGAMVGLERTIVPLIAKDEFGIQSSLIILSFLVSFGLTKAMTNLFAGRLLEHLGRKKILVAGWVFGLAVPILLIFAQSWGWVVVANILLGINQGLCWSNTVIMQVDLVGPKWRGVATGVNEFAGYSAVALSTLMTGFLATAFGPYPVSSGQPSRWGWAQAWSIPPCWLQYPTWLTLTGVPRPWGSIACGAMEAMRLVA